MQKHNLIKLQIRLDLGSDNMSVNIKSNGLIIMNRGDTLITTISIFNPDGTEYIPDPNNDTLRFALKKNYDDAEPLILKDIPVDTMVLRIDAEDTKILD